MTTPLRQKVARLAAERPELRKHLVPLLREAGFGDEMEAARQWEFPEGSGWPSPKNNNKDYDAGRAISKSDCYVNPNHTNGKGKGLSRVDLLKGEGGGQGKPGKGTCYRLHNEYGSANSGKPGSEERKKYNKKYRDTWMDEGTKTRKTCPDGHGGKGPCGEGKK
jgi:hypothetical protein